jgi:hypothetical protein
MAFVNVDPFRGFPDTPGRLRARLAILLGLVFAMFLLMNAPFTTDLEQPRCDLDRVTTGGYPFPASLRHSGSLSSAGDRGLATEGTAPTADCPRTEVFLWQGALADIAVALVAGFFAAGPLARWTVRHNPTSYAERHGGRPTRSKQKDPR